MTTEQIESLMTELQMWRNAYVASLTGHEGVTLLQVVAARQMEFNVIAYGEVIAEIRK